jgi:hypothetical protein
VSVLTVVSDPEQVQKQVQNPYGGTQRPERPERGEVAPWRDGVAVAGLETDRPEVARRHFGADAFRSRHVARRNMPADLGISRVRATPERPMRTSRYAPASDEGL